MEEIDIPEDFMDYHDFLDEDAISAMQRHEGPFAPAKKINSEGCSPSQFRKYREEQRISAKNLGLRDKLWFDIDPNHVPEWPCCYVIYHGFFVVYVGQTENLRQRLKGHVTKGRFVNGFGDYQIKAKLDRRFGAWLMTEIRLIKRLQPSMNRRGVASREEISQ